MHNVRRVAHGRDWMATLIQVDTNVSRCPPLLSLQQFLNHLTALGGL